MRSIEGRESNEAAARLQWFALGWLGAVAFSLATSITGCSSNGSGAGRSIHTALPDDQAQVRAAFVAARQAASAQQAAHAVRTQGNEFIADNPVTRTTAEFGAAGATLARAGEPWSASVAATQVGCVGQRPASVEHVSSPRQGVSANRVEYPERAGETALTEWYAHGSLGIEHGFTLDTSPCSAASGGDGDVLIKVGVAGLEPVEGPMGVELRDRQNVTRVHYTDLSGKDADGMTLAVGMGVEAGAMVLRIAAGAARFPVQVDPLLWVQMAELTSEDGAANDEFGSSVAISGNVAVIGAPYHMVGGDAGQGAEQGTAYVFMESDGAWTQQQELTASDGQAYDSFGTSVSLSGTTIVVGAPYHTVGVNSGQGAAYVFIQSHGLWTQQQELTASDGQAYDSFGESVSVAGGTALVGAFEHVVGANSGQGAAYVFEQAGSTWTQQGELLASDGMAYDYFGSTVSISGSTALVGAFTHMVGSNQYQGAAYVFTGSDGTWIQQQELTASDGVADDEFGNAVLVSGGTAVVGAPDHMVGTNVDQGAVYVFVEGDGGTWMQQQELSAGDGRAHDSYFASAVSLSGNTIVVGSYSKTLCSSQQGAAYVFSEGDGGAWTQQQELTASDGVAPDGFGFSVSVSGSTALVGASGHQIGANAYQGAVYVEDFEETDGGTGGVDGGLMVGNGGLSCTAGLTNCSCLCVNQGNDYDNCGACGNVCQPGQTCSDGSCLLYCQAGLSACGGICVDEQTDPSNCGGCGNPCPAGNLCTGGTCVLSCQTGLTNCGGTCVNEQTDLSNCGGCGKACPAGEVCSAGTCALTCQTGLTVCSGACVNEQTDPSNCGGCGTTCPAGDLCSAGACTLQCPSGLTNCGGTCVDEQIDPNNCGGCVTRCPASGFCSAGACEGSKSSGCSVAGHGVGGGRSDRGADTLLVLFAAAYVAGRRRSRRAPMSARGGA